MTQKVVIYTDGSCMPNPGKGGWAAILLIEGQKEPKMISGAENPSTNNRMELTAATEALKVLDSPATIDLFTDSQYLQQGITSWMKGWVKKNWKTSSGSPVKNIDLWKPLAEEMQRHNVNWHWVQGHAGNIWNERVDRLAQQARQGR